MKNQTEVTLNLSSNVISDSNDATISHELLLIDTQVSRLSKTSNCLKMGNQKELLLRYLRV